MKTWGVEGTSRGVKPPTPPRQIEPWGYGHWEEEEEDAGNGKRGSRVPSWKLLS